MKIETPKAQLLWSCGPTNQHLYYTAQYVPQCTTIATTNHFSSYDHYSSTDHFPLYHIAHQPVQSIYIIKMSNQVVLINLSLPTKLSPLGSNQLLIPLSQYESNQLHIRKLVPILLNKTNLYQYVCVPVQNQSYTCVNLIKCSDSKPTLLTCPSSSRDTFEQPRYFTYGQPNFFQSHSTQWHHNQHQSQSNSTN